MNRTPLRRAVVAASAAVAVATSSALLLTGPAAAEDAGPTPTPTASATAGPTPTATAEPTASPEPDGTPQPTGSAAPEPDEAAEPAPAPTGGPAAEPRVQAQQVPADEQSGVTAAADDEAVAAAAAWLADQLGDDGTVGTTFDGTYYPDYGRTLDLVLALLAAGGEDDALRRALAAATEPDAVASYTQGAPYDREDAAYAGATAKLMTAVALTGGDPTDVGGVDLVEQLRSVIGADGRVADRSDYGDYANLFSQAFAVLAHVAAGLDVPDDVLAALTGEQCGDGGFPEGFDGAVCTSQVDATGLVLQALAAAGLGDDAAAQDARTWLLGRQQDDGSWPGEVPVNSTGYAAMGLLALGDDVTEARQWLASVQNDDGGLPASEGGESDSFATSQALPTLDGTFFLASARAVDAPAPAPSSPAPAPSDRPEGEDPDDEPAGVLPTSGTTGSAPTPGTSASALPRTGSEVRSVLAAAAVLLLAGAALVVTGRRRRA